jgi:predicted RNase H-like nuclease (RuvC/YqgF family)
MSSESSFKSEDSVSDGDSVSDNGEESETERINTKYSKRFDALEDYKEKNTLLSEMSVKDVMNKLDKDEELSTQELETLNRTFRLMDKTIPNDQDSLERMQLYEAFSEIVPSEISENNERIEHHEKKISEYLARLEELKQENSEMSSDNDSSDSNSTIVPNTNNPSNSPGSDDSSNLPGPGNPSGSSGPDDDDDDGFDDFPPSFDFDDF